MPDHYPAIMLHLGSALLAGSLIGLERSIHGRPAGFRTHALVCLASALLMLITLYQDEWLETVARETIRADPTRVAQGIMTGIGFLGAGVIFKERFTVRGLTTAASIWITAAIGIMFGIGFYFPAVVATVATLTVLALFRYVEGWLTTRSSAYNIIRFARDSILPEADLRALLNDHGFTISKISYRQIAAGTMFEYRMLIYSDDAEAPQRLVRTLASMPAVLEFRLSMTGE